MNAVGFMNSVMAFEAHGHVFCSDLMFFRCKKSFRRQVEMVENVEADPGGSVK